MTPDTTDPQETCVCGNHRLCADHYGRHWAWIRTADDGNPATCGKWMLFIPSTQIVTVWANIENAVNNGRLGHVAKCSVAPNNRGIHLICVYTKDYSDLDDVTRVLTRLRTMGYSQRLSYKEDNATRSLKYGVGAALYVAAPNSTKFRQTRDPVTEDDRYEPTDEDYE